MGKEQKQGFGIAAIIFIIASLAAMAWVWLRPLMRIRRWWRLVRIYDILDA